MSKLTENVSVPRWLYWALWLSVWLTVVSFGLGVLAKVLK